MMYITPLYIQFNNFLSYEKETFYFEKGFHLIYGVNGSGKTNIFEGLLYCFTGRTFKGLKGDDVIRDGQKSCKIKFVFMADDKKGVIVVKRKPNKIFFKVGNKVFNSFSIKEKQSMIQDWFGFDFEVLTKFFFVGENEKYKFSFLGADDTEKKKLLTKISKSELIDEANDNIKERISNKEKQFNGYVLIKEERKRSLIELKEDLEKKRLKLLLFKKNSISDSKIKKLRSDVEKAKDIFLTYKKEFETFEKQIDDFIEKNEKVCKELSDLIWDLKKKEMSFINEKNLILSKINSIIKCNKCGNLINKTGNTKKQWEEKIKKLDEKIFSTQKFLKQKEEELKTKKEYKKSIDYISLVKKNNFSLEKRDTNEQIYLRLNQELLKLESHQESEKKFLKKDIEEIKEKIILKRKSIEKFQQREDETKKELDLLKKFSYWFGKEGFKNYLFSKKLKLIEYVVNKVLNEIGTETYILLEGLTRLKSGKFSKKIKGFVFIDGKKKREYKELSKGEARKIDLAFIIAFRRLLSFKHIFNLSSFDEPFGGLDNKNLESVIDMLKNTDYSTYIISPNLEIQEFFDSNEIINIEKINGVSKIN